MKQTKPYGQAAYVPRASESVVTTAEPALETERETAAASSTESSSTESSSGSADSASSNSPSKPQPWQQPKQSHLVRNLVLVFVLVPLLLCGYVLMRDSLRAMGAIDIGSGQDSVMYCKVGSISYEGMDIMDRILGNGAFVCTDWHTGSRFITLPKGPHFVEQ